MARIDKVTVDRILDATNIVDVVSDFVSLKKRGSSYLGLCPFHNERTPSFSVSASRGIYKCFSCGVGGTAVSFLMDLEHMSYIEAIKWLGRKYGIEVQERELSSAEKQAEAARESMFAVNEFALKHFETTMADTEDGQNIGMTYFRERGINDEMIKRFHLGYALDKSDDLYAKAVAAGFDEKYLIETGLCIRTDQGRVYDRFKGRVIYPVHSLSGRVVAFGGRTLSKEKTVAKYVNSPESSIYSKSNELYGMYQARNAIAKKKNCILVEGYMDVISMHQAGVENVVASSGTSLTDGQIRMIKRFADKVTLIYDSDPAGVKAALRGINMFVAAGLSLKLVLLPEGDDPDSFAQSHTTSELEQYIAENEQDLIGFKVDVLMKDSVGDPRKRSDAINDILQTISLIPNLVEQALYVDECASHVGVSNTVLAAQVKKFILQRREEEYKRSQYQQAASTIADIAPDIVDEPQITTITPLVKSTTAIYKAEEELIRFVLRYGMLYMCDVYADDNSDTPVPMSVIDYIECELGNDGVQFSVPQFATIWKMAIDMRNAEWASLSAANVEECERRRQAEREAGQQQLLSLGLGSDEIQKLEEKLEARLETNFTRQVDEFASAFICSRLLRSDDRVLTDLVVTLTTDTVVLSKMYPKVDVRQEVCEKLPIAVNTLKGVLLKEHIKELLDQLSAMPEGQSSEANQLMEEIMRLKQLSMEFDKFNGELVIVPKHKK